MDGDLRRLIAKVAGAVVAIAVFALGMKFGCGDHRDPAADSRRDLLATGCNEAGFDRTSPRFRPCLDRAKEHCTMGDDAVVIQCQPDPRASSAPVICSTLIACAKGVGDGMPK